MNYLILYFLLSITDNTFHNALVRQITLRRLRRWETDELTGAAAAAGEMLTLQSL